MGLGRVLVVPGGTHAKYCERITVVLVDLFPISRGSVLNLLIGTPNGY